MTANLDYYFIFYYVGKYKSISRAAREMIMSQPNVTRAMNNLESQLGCKLMVRSAKGIQLTPAGDKLYHHVSIAIEHLISGEREMKNEQELKAGELFVAATEIALHRTLLPALQQFRTNYPGVRIRVSNYSTFEAIEAVRKEQSELAVVTLSEPERKDLTCIPLATYSEFLTAGFYYKELTQNIFSLSDLYKYPWISLNHDTQTFQFYDRLFLEKGYTFAPDLEAATMDQILPMVERDLGLAFLPDFIAMPEIEAGHILKVQLSDAIPCRTICLLYKNKKLLSAPAKELINILQNFESERSGLSLR